MHWAIKQLIFRESGGFAGLQRGCTMEPAALPEVPRSELEELVERRADEAAAADAPAQLGAAAAMPDMQLYTLELILARAAEPAPQPEHRVLHYPASDVPRDVSALIEFLREHAKPL